MGVAIDASVSVLLVNFACAAFLCGISWHLQISQYPLLATVGDAKTVRLHGKLTSRVMAVPMLAELVTSVILCMKPSFIQPEEAMVGLGLVILIWGWGVTMLRPANVRLSADFSRANVEQRMQLNWIVTVAWTLRLALLVKVLGRQGYVGVF